MRRFRALSSAPWTVLSICNVVVLLTAPVCLDTLNPVYSFLIPLRYISAATLPSSARRFNSNTCFTAQSNTCLPFPTIHAYSLQRVMHSVLSGRVLLHMREAAANPNGFPSQQISTIGGPSTNVRFEGPTSFFMAPEDAGYPMHDLRDLRSSRKPATERPRRAMSPYKIDEYDRDDWESSDR